MIRTLALAAAAAAVGFKLGQRAAENAESRFSQPEVTGDDPGGYIDADDVVVEGGEATLSDDVKEDIASNFGNTDIAAHQIEWPDRDDDEVIGQ